VYRYGSGTSGAAPLVTAAASLLWAQNPTWSADTVKTRILNTVDVLPWLDGKLLTSGRLNLRKALDNQSPDAVTDLSVEVSRTVAKITWTAPGNNGDEGTASAYDLRFSMSPITDASSFNSATPITTAAPDTSGTEECAIQGGLGPCIATLYFAIKTWDDAFNVSGLSNVPTATPCDSTTALTCD
jgi:subtilisin family serine protease